jgi:pyridoxal phosphate enzyme (YggS family)
VSRADDIAAGLARVRERIAAAERAAGRPSGSVRLVAVSKKMTVDDVRAALAAGQLDLGESYGQELRDKRQALVDAPVVPRWHFIGPLQANKVKYVAGHVALVHSIDAAELLDELERRGRSPGPVPGPVQACLVQVNVSGEAQKRGVAPAALPALLDRFSDLSHVRCEGLMTVPPLTDDPFLARPHFAALRALRDREAARARPHVDLRELSMGMSHDLEVAVAEGATLVRVGTAIFGAR